MASNSNKRIIFIDLMRAFAVLLMVQGHTIDTFLGDQYRSFDSSLFNVWYTIRGFTAPIFMFTSGVAFTYLLRLNSNPFSQNPRVIKGVYRFFILVIAGYLLRYPTHLIFDFTNVTHAQWMTFFTVDALQLIGFGLLFLLILSYIGEKFNLNFYYVLIIGTSFFFGLFLLIDGINWANYIPIPFAAYFYHGTGSYFPLFPWAGYVIGGGILGLYLAQNPLAYNSKKFTFSLLGISLASFFVCFLIHLLEDSLYGIKTFWTDNLALIFYRLGMVLILNSAMSYIAIRLKTIPDIVQQVGKNTLLIYVVHVIILYGSIWIPGFGMFYSKTLNIPFSIMAALLMVILMIGMVVLLERFKSNNSKRNLAVKIESSRSRA
ncbi:MAG: hypothetical protein CVV24_07320 [Ignavibacteriae bacterium HGW-Ignavibacteriae-3]|nr:MAG: hypothetical protein CVV24_07320 [Ignavibacteriae bacterium HGW-Ignavibacteriae-3]